MKIVLITRDRPELTRQTIETMKANAVDWSRHKLIVVWDGKYPGGHPYLDYPGCQELHVFEHGKDRLIETGTQQGVGGAKNLGAEIFLSTDNTLKPDDILMFSDNDMYYLPDWDLTLENCLSQSGVTQLGGWKHPFHATSENYGWQGVGAFKTFVNEVDAVTGNCFVIRWADWLKYGPFDANAIGPGQSEDYALSQRIKAGGGIVATLDPPVAIHCGLANCLGEPATGWEEMSKMAEQQIKDYGIDKIWLATPDEGTILLESIRQNNHNIILGGGNLCNANSFSGINCGSGQRRFDSSKGWINVDCISRPPDQIPDVICDATKLVEKFGENTQDMVVLHHVLEHFGCGEADEVIRQCYRVLKPGGSLLVFVPDMRKLAGRWLNGEIDDYIFFVNTYGAYQGEDGDRHKWGYSRIDLTRYLYDILDSLSDPSAFGADVSEFDWREIPGADIAKDWWILGVEVIK